MKTVNMTAKKEKKGRIVFRWTVSAFKASSSWPNPCDPTDLLAGFAATVWYSEKKAVKTVCCYERLHFSSRPFIQTLHVTKSNILPTFGKIPTFEEVSVREHLLNEK